MAAQVEPRGLLDAATHTGAVHQPVGEVGLAGVAIAGGVQRMNIARWCTAMRAKDQPDENNMALQITLGPKPGIHAGQRTVRAGNGANVDKLGLGACRACRDALTSTCRFFNNL